MPKYTATQNKFKKFHYADQIRSEGGKEKHTAIQIRSEGEKQRTSPLNLTSVAWGSRRPASRAARGSRAPGRLGRWSVSGHAARAWVSDLDLLSLSVSVFFSFFHFFSGFFSGFFVWPEWCV